MENELAKNNVSISYTPLRNLAFFKTPYVQPRKEEEGTGVKVTIEIRKMYISRQLDLLKPLQKTFTILLHQRF